MDRPYPARRVGATHPRWPVGAAADLGVLAALAIVCAALVSLIGWRAPALRPVVAGQTGAGPAFYAGLHGVEQDAEGSLYRWTTGSALVQLRGAYYTAPTYLAELRLRAGNPDGPQPLTLLSGGRPIITVVPETRFRTYRLLLPDPGLAGGELWLGLQTPVFSPPGDPRPLGVMLTDVGLTPVAGPGLLGGVTVALGIVALWAALRVFGVGRGSALAMVALAGLGLVALVALPRPPVAPQPLMGALILAGVAGAGLAARGPAARMGLAALTILVALSGRLWPAWLSDDAFISFRYAQNLVQGHGLVYNLGERVEGYTNFLWTILAALVVALGGDVAVWSHVAGAALGVAVVLLTYRLGARLAGAPWGLLAALIVGTSQSLLLYTGRGSGLETGLFTLLLLAASERYLAFAVPHPPAPSPSRGEGEAGHGAMMTAPPLRAQGEGGRRGEGRVAPLVSAGLLLALAALTRPEGVLVSGLTAGHLAVTLAAAAYGVTSRTPPLMPCGRGGWEARVASTIPWRPLAALCGAFLAVFLPYFLWRLWYYGDLLPNTFYAKTGGGLSQALRGLEYAGGFALSLGGPLLLVMLAPWAVGWRTAIASWRGYLLPVVLAYTGYIVVVGGDHFRGERFFVPLLPWAAILVADGLATGFYLVARRQGGRESPHIRRLVARLALALVIGAGALAALARTTPIDPTMQGLDESVWVWRDIGWWMADHAPPAASLAAAGAGAVAYYGQHETIDLYGLTEKHIGRMTVERMGAGVAGHEKRDPAYVLEVRRPTYIPRIWDEYFGGAAALEDRYRLITITTRSGRELQLWERRP